MLGTPSIAESVSDSISEALMALAAITKTRAEARAAKSSAIRRLRLPIRNPRFSAHVQLMLISKVVVIDESAGTARALNVFLISRNE